MRQFPAAAGGAISQPESLLEARRGKVKQAANISLRLQLSRQGYSAESATQRVAALRKTKFDKEGTENDLTQAILVHLRKCPEKAKVS